MRYQYQEGKSEKEGGGGDPNKETFSMKQMNNDDNSMIKIDMMLMSPK